MSNTAITAAWKAEVQPAARKLVLLFMADSLNDKTGQLNPSVDAVARACGMSADQARRHLHALIDAGLLSVVGNGNGGYHREASRRYKLHLDAVTPGTDATPCTSATPCTDAADPLHGSREPLAPMQLTPCTHASQTRKNQKEPEKNQKVESAKRAAPLPDEFKPDAVGMNYANQHGIAVAEELENFRDYHLARGLTRKDWQASWRTWCRNAVRFGRAATSSPNAAAIPTRSKKAVPRENFDAVDYGQGIRAL